jgi:septal ring factor EnvC (AmiA/AmiB activator)
MFADPDNLHAMLRTASVLENTNEALADRATDLKKQLKDLKALKTRVGKNREELGKERTQLTAEQQALKKELEARQTVQAKLTVDHEKAEARVAELSRQSRSLQELLSKLAREPAAKKSRESRDFAGAKGNMRAPAIGDVVHSFGEKKNENETWRGMVLRARPSGTVVAPYDGEVVFTGPFRDYGRMVLLKHSNGFISLLAGLGTIQVGLNQAVSRGEPMGTMPNAASPELYMELRDRSKPIDPADWFANVGRRLAKS